MGAQNLSISATTTLPGGSATPSRTTLNAAANSTTTAPRTFSTDTVVPVVTLTAITGPTQDTTPNYQGNAGNATGDSSTVTLKIYTGMTPTGSPVRTIAAPTTGTVSKTWGPVANGDYTSPPTAVTATGSYFWKAEYSGDQSNLGIQNACQDANETSVILRVTPTVVSQSSRDC